MNNEHFIPANQTAVNVVFKKGFQFEPDLKICQIHSKNPIRTKKTPKGTEDLTGFKKDCLTVVGLYCENNPNKNTSPFEKEENHIFINRCLMRQRSIWVVRCSCGNYETRRAKSLKKENPDYCHECRHVIHLKRQQYFRHTGKWPEDRKCI
jgi:hypothetical protein